MPSSRSHAQSSSRRLDLKPYALLVFTSLCWAGNVVVGQLAIGEVSPLLIVFLRWVIVASCLLAFNWRKLLAAWPVLRQKLGMLLLMAALGFTGFNALFYVAAHYTKGVNIGIIQGTMPALVLLGAVIFYRSPVRLLQGLGVLATMLGVVVVAAGGDLGRLAALSLNSGDLIMLFACILYAGYAVALKRRPQVPAMVFFTALSVIAMLSSLPLVIYEQASGNLVWPTWGGWLVVAYVALFPSFLAQITFIRGVELIGPERAGVFVNLVPIFAAILAVLILAEPFELYHAVALVLVLGGIALAESRKYKAVPPG
ncbi:MAG: DMT family transporter [Rhodovibrionaceae bacterium]